MVPPEQVGFVRASNGHIYSLDFPGLTLSVMAPPPGQQLDLSGGYDRIVQRMNAQEFVRVKLDGSGFPDDYTHSNQTPEQQKANPAPVQGSRASELIDWYSRLDFAWVNLNWVRTANAGQAVYNGIDLGQINIGQPGQ